MAVAGSLGGGGAGAAGGGAVGPAGPGAPVVAGGGGESDLETMDVWLATVVVVVGDAVVWGRVAGGAVASAWAGMGTVNKPATVRSDTTPAAVIRPWRPHDGSVTSP